MQLLHSMPQCVRRGKSFALLLRQLLMLSQVPASFAAEVNRLLAHRAELERMEEGGEEVSDPYSVAQLLLTTLKIGGQHHSVCRCPGPRGQKIPTGS